MATNYITIKGYIKNGELKVDLLVLSGFKIGVGSGERSADGKGSCGCQHSCRYPAQVQTG